MLKYFLTNEQTSPVDAEIDAVLGAMQKVGVDHEKYPQLMTHLERLYEVKAKSRAPRISRDVWVTAGANLLGILIIVAYEQKHVLTSKGFSHIIRPKGTY